MPLHKYAYITLHNKYITLNIKFLNSFTNY